MPSLRRAAAWTLTAGAFAADWVAVATDRRRLELAAKPAAMPALALASVESGLLEKPWGRQVLAGQAFGLGGDAFLLRDDERSFLAGLSSFLVGHLAYIDAFRRMGLRRTAWVVPGAVALAGCMWWSRDALPSLWREGGAAAAGPVAGYMGVIGAMSLVDGQPARRGRREPLRRERHRHRRQQLRGAGRGLGPEDHGPVPPRAGAHRCGSGTARVMMGA